MRVIPTDVYDKDGKASEREAEIEIKTNEKGEENKYLLEYPKYDLHSLTFDETFDFFLFNQTIEH